MRLSARDEQALVQGVYDASLRAYEPPISGLPAIVLPVHIVPCPDEALTSWLVRLAAAHGHKLQTFCALVWPRQPIWNRDFDRSAPPDFLRDLARRTSVDESRAAATHLRAFAGRLFPDGTARIICPGAEESPRRSGHDGDVPLGGSLLRPPSAYPWVLRAGVWHRTRRAGWVQCCPACLADDAEPYFRLTWRAACLTACARHARVLIDRCPACRKPLEYFRGEMGVRRRYAAPPMSVCPACGRDWRVDRRPKVVRSISEAERAIDRSLHAALAGTPVTLADGATMGAAAYFAVLRHLCRALLSPGRAGRVRLLVPAEPRTARWEEALAHTATSGREEIEARPLAVRRAAVHAAAALLEHWPDQFIARCVDARVWSTDLLRDARELPPWFVDSVRQALYRPLPSGARRRPRQPAP